MLVSPAGERPSFLLATDMPMRGPHQPATAEDDESESDEDKEMCMQPTALERAVSALEEAHRVLEENEGATVPEDISINREMTYLLLSLPLCQHTSRYLKGTHRGKRHSPALGTWCKGKHARVCLQKANQPV